MKGSAAGIKALSSVLAGKASDKEISTIFDELANSEKPIIGFDPCIYGICINYGFDGRHTKFDFEDFAVGGLGDIIGGEVIIDGITQPEFTRLRMQYQF